MKEEELYLRFMLHLAPRVLDAYNSTQVLSTPRGELAARQIDYLARCLTTQTIETIKGMRAEQEKINENN